MGRAFRAALVALGFILFSLRGWAQQEVFVPGKDAAGYSVVPIDNTEKAPAGYEGQTHKSTQTSAGNTPAEIKSKGSGTRPVRANLKMATLLRIVHRTVNGIQAAPGGAALIPTSRAFRATGGGSLPKHGPLKI